MIDNVILKLQYAESTVIDLEKEIVILKDKLELINAQYSDLRQRMATLAEENIILKQACYR